MKKALWNFFYEITAFHALLLGLITGGIFIAGVFFGIYVCK